MSKKINIRIIKVKYSGAMQKEKYIHMYEGRPAKMF